MKTTLKLTNLPTELLEWIFELAIDADFLERQNSRPEVCIQVLLASSQINSRLRAIALSYRPIWRKLAGAIPSVLLSETTFGDFFAWLGHQTGESLNVATFALSEWSTTTLCYWLQVDRAIDCVSYSAAHLQELRLTTTACNVVACECIYCRQYGGDLEGPEARSDTLLSWQRKAASASSKFSRLARRAPKLTTVEMEFSDLIRLINSSSRLPVAPKTLCLVAEVFTISQYQEQAWRNVCLRIENLCLYLPQGRSLNVDIDGRLTTTLRDAHLSLRCLELHTAFDMKGFNVVEMPVLERLRAHRLRSACSNSPIPEASKCHCPALQLVDAPASFLEKLFAPGVRSAALSLAKGTDDSKVVDQLMLWTELDSLVLHLDRLATARISSTISTILWSLNPARQGYLLAPNLRRLGVTTQPPAWHSPPYTSQFAIRSDDHWWSEEYRQGFVEGDNCLPYIPSELFNLEYQRRILAQEGPASSSCRALDSIIFVGFDVPTEDWAKLMKDSSCFTKVCIPDPLRRDDEV